MLFTTEDHNELWSLHLTCSEGFRAFPSELLRWRSPLGLFLESSSEQFGRKVVAVGWHLPQRRRPVDDLRDVTCEQSCQSFIFQLTQVNISLWRTQQFPPGDRAGGSSSVSTDGNRWACAIACSSCSTHLPWHSVGHLLPPLGPCGSLYLGGQHLHHEEWGSFDIFVFSPPKHWYQALPLSVEECAVMFLTQIFFFFFVVIIWFDFVLFCFNFSFFYMLTLLFQHQHHEQWVYLVY